MTCKIGKSKWHSINGQFIPTIILKHGGAYYAASCNSDNCLPLDSLEIRFDRLEIDNQLLSGLNGYAFKFPIQSLDSLQLAALNSNLDSIFNAYNDLLLSASGGEYDTTLSDYQTISESDTIDRLCSFIEQASLMEAEHHKLTDYVKEIMAKYSPYRERGLFTNAADFNNFYSKGEEALQTEVEKRSLLKRLKNLSDLIKTLDLQYKYGGKDVHTVLSIVREAEGKTYYMHVVEYIIEINERLNREWNENGKYFADKVKFYKAYLSDDYNKIIRKNKEESMENRQYDKTSTEGERYNNDVPIRNTQYYETSKRFNR